MEGDPSGLSGLVQDHWLHRLAPRYLRHSCWHFTEGDEAHSSSPSALSPHRPVALQMEIDRAILLSATRVVSDLQRRLNRRPVDLFEPRTRSTTFDVLIAKILRLFPRNIWSLTEYNLVLDFNEIPERRTSTYKRRIFFNLPFRHSWKNEAPSVS